MSALAFCTCDPATARCEFCRRTRKLNAARDRVILMARVAVAGDDDQSDPNLKALRRSLTRFDAASRPAADTGGDET